MEMNAQASRIEAGSWPITRERVAALLGRYPDVSKDENRAILDFMKAGRHLDIGLLTSNESLRPKLDAFMEDHKKHFRVSFGEAAAVIAMIAAFVLVVWLSWELRSPNAF
jgi:hypothetical protein